ncbi:Desmoplakin [Hyphantria cunea nucleopolyhedrovirus]|uniref:Desmoplakin n=1 Tax=Hyphantria cunea nuclear polyhedrosis virus TaxID=28288 RepID=Q2NP27_NPVHC|nr:Desmoplakin [Hyphantria cunea nucleopolyhedrovirus]BAE72373.1 Desmoplakin [Hyphantria cunea nucleopolyhedrovirus]
MNAHDSKRVTARHNKIARRVIAKRFLQLIVSEHFHFAKMQRDLLNTINSMSARIKALERYEHALREIHKVIVVLRPSFNLQVLDPDAMPALIVQFFSDLPSHNTTHNINYKYDYNVGGALPFQPPPPQPFNPYGQYWPQTPPQPPQQPPQPPQQPPPPQQQSPPPQQQSPIPPQQQSLQPVPQQAIVQQIELSMDEMRELQILQQNMQQQTITWGHYAAFITTMTQIMQTRVVNSTFLIKSIEALKNVDKLVNYDFNEFLRCVARETSVTLNVTPDLCPTVAVFINFFKNTHMTIYNMAFTYVNVQTLTTSVESLHMIVVKLFQFFYKIHRVIMKTDYVYTSSGDLIGTIDRLYTNVQLLPLAKQNESELAMLQKQVREERADNLKLQNEKIMIEQNLQSSNDLNHSLSLELNQLKLSTHQIKTLQFNIDNLTRENNDLKYEINTLRNQIEAPITTYYEQYTQEKQKRNELQTEIQTMQIKISELQALVTGQDAQINTGKAKYDVEVGVKESEYKAIVSQMADEYKNNLQIAQTQFNEKTVYLQNKIADLQQTITQQNNELSAQNEKLQNLNSINTELMQQIQRVTEQSKEQLASIQTAAPMETDKEKVDKEELDYLLSVLNNVYQNAKFFTPNLVEKDLSQDLGNLQFNLARQQEFALSRWFAILKETTAPNDLLNFGSLTTSGMDALNDLKSQIVNIIPSDVLRNFDKSIVKREDFDKIDNVTLISAVSTLTAQHKEFSKQNKSLRATNTELQTKFATLDDTCKSEIRSLQTDLAKNKSDVAAIQNLVNTTPELDTKSMQNVRNELDAAKSKLNNLKEAKLNDLKQMANTSVQEEMSKLNSKIREINSLLSNYTTVTENIFEWKTMMLTMYESLARIVADESFSPPSV